MRRPGFRTSRLVMLIAMAVLSGVSTARADPLAVTTGSLVVYWDGSATPFTLIGDGFAVGGGAPGGAAAQQITPGKVLDLSTIVAGNRLGFGPATVGDFEGSAYYDGTLNFTATPFVVPPSTAASLSLSTSFTMAGQLLGFPTFDRIGTPLFTVALAGAGTATIGPLKNLVPLGVDSYLLHSGGLLFQFADDQAPVPEPASMLLLGTGLAGLAAARARRRRSSGGV